MDGEEAAKRAVGFAAVDRFVRDGTCIGLGTGTTAFWAIVRVAERIDAGLRVRVVPTSIGTQRECEKRNIPVVGLGEETIDIAIDGADEATAGRSLLKGGGGALFREKAVALAAKTFVAIVSERKVVSQLGAFPLPVEVVPFSKRYVQREIEGYGVDVAERVKAGSPYVTDNGNAILDCHFGTIANPLELDRLLRDLHGVVATGLFIGITDRLLIAGADGAVGEL